MRKNGNKIIAKAMLAFFVCNVIQKGLSLISTPIFTRILSTDDYGLVSVYNSWEQIFLLLCTLRLDYGVFNKGMSKYENKKASYTLTMQWISTFITTLLLIIYVIFKNAINEITGLTTILTISMIFSGLSTAAISYWTAEKRYDYQYKEVVFVTLLESVLILVISVITTVHSSHKAYAKIISGACVTVILGIIIYIYNIRSCEPKKRRPDSEIAKFALKFNLPLIPHYLSTYILDQSDRLMIQKMIGYTAAGLYSVVYNLGMALKIITNSINNVLVPWQYRKLQREEFEELDKCMNVFMILVAAFIIELEAVAPEVLLIFAGKNYYEARYCVIPVATSCFFIFVWGIYGNAEFYYDANNFTMYISIIGAILNLILNYIFIPKYGYIAAAYTTLVCYIIFTISHFIFVSKLSYRITGKHIYSAKKLFLISSSLVIFSLIIGIFYNYTVIRYCFFAVVFVILLINKNKIVKYIKSIKE